MPHNTVSNYIVNMVSINYDRSIALSISLEPFCSKNPVSGPLLVLMFKGQGSNFPNSDIGFCDLCLFKISLVVNNTLR